MDRCQYCGYDKVPREAQDCPNCGKHMSAEVGKPAASGLSSRRRLARIVWGIALLAMIFFAVDGFFSFQLATSAPQQGAAAAWACFQMIVPYVIARAIHEALTA